MSDKTKNRLIDLKRIQDFEVSFLTVDISQFKNLPTWSGNYATYYRLILPEILNVDKIIYLDCDIIVNMDIQKLWEIDLKDKSIGAVGSNFHSDYFNSGVLIMRLKKLREDNFCKKWRSFLASVNLQTLRFPDQDILNAVLKGRVLYLPFTYNVKKNYYDYLLENNLDRENIIVHYTPGKPLAMDCPPYLRNLYFKYSQMTAYKENMLDFWIRYLRFYPCFYIRSKHWKKIRQMREMEKCGK